MNNENLDLTKEKVQVENGSGDSLLISVKEACRIVGIGRNSLLKMVRLRGFPAIIMPGKILIDKNELPNWIRKNYGKYEN